MGNKSPAHNIIESWSSCTPIPLKRLLSINKPNPYVNIKNNFELKERYYLNVRNVRDNCVKK